MMSGAQPEQTDDDLLAILARSLATSTSLAEAVMHAGRTAFSWRTLDAELATLLQSTPPEELTVRASEDVRHYTFDSGSTVVDVAVEDRNGTLVVRGWIDPPAASTIRLVGSGGAELAVGTADDLGRFRIPVDASGPVRLEIQREPPLQTEWFRLG